MRIICQGAGADAADILEGKSNLEQFIARFLPSGIDFTRKNTNDPVIDDI